MSITDPLGADPNKFNYSSNWMVNIPSVTSGQFFHNTNT